LGKVKTGAKAGGISGIIYGAITAFLVYLTYTLSKEEVLSEILMYLETLSDSQITVEEYYNGLLIIGPISSFILGILIGLIFGIIFAFFYDRIPGKNYWSKAIFYGIILWLILFVFGLYIPLWLPFEYNLAISLILSWVLCLLIGFIYNRLGIISSE